MALSLLAAEQAYKLAKIQEEVKIQVVQEIEISKSRAIEVLREKYDVQLKEHQSELSSLRSHLHKLEELLDSSKKEV